MSLWRAISPCPRLPFLMDDDSACSSGVMIPSPDQKAILPTYGYPRVSIPTRELLTRELPDRHPSIYMTLKEDIYATNDLTVLFNPCLRGSTVQTLRLSNRWGKWVKKSSSEP